jgi:hypothetical protein
MQIPPDERRRWAEALHHFSLVTAPPGWAETTYGTTYYADVWESCTDVEKLALIHVAEEGFANPKQRHTTEALLRRGLLKRTPALELFDKGFADFVQGAYDRSELASIEKPAYGMGWSGSRWVLMLLLLGLAMFLLGTQREALNPIVAFIPSLAASVTAILKLLGEFAPRQRSPAS